MSMATGRAMLTQANTVNPNLNVIGNRRSVAEAKTSYSTDKANHLDTLLDSR
jgi:hypothetical protein